MSNCNCGKCKTCTGSLWKKFLNPRAAAREIARLCGCLGDLEAKLNECCEGAGEHTVDTDTTTELGPGVVDPDTGVTTYQVTYVNVVTGTTIVGPVISVPPDTDTQTVIGPPVVDPVTGVTTYSVAYVDEDGVETPGNPIVVPGPPTGGDGSLVLSGVGSGRILTNTNSNGGTNEINICDLMPEASAGNSLSGNSTGTFSEISFRGENDEPVSGSGLDTPVADFAQKVFVAISGGCKKVFNIIVEDWHQNTLYVDGTYGNDSTGLRERHDRPFKTVSSAYGASQSGDKIFVHTGVYTEPRITVAHDITFSMEGVTYNGDIWADGDLRMQILGKPDMLGGGSGRTLFIINGADARLEIGLLRSISLALQVYEPTELGTRAWLEADEIQGSCYATGVTDGSGKPHMYVSVEKARPTLAPNPLFYSNRGAFMWVDVRDARNEFPSAGAPGAGSCFSCQSSFMWIDCDEAVSVNASCVVSLSFGAIRGETHMITGRYKSESATRATVDIQPATDQRVNIHAGSVVLHDGTHPRAIEKPVGVAAAELRLYSEVTIEKPIGAGVILLVGTADVNPNAE